VNFFANLEERFMGFGEKLKELRGTVGLSQEKLANKLEISKRTIIDYENNKHLPPAELLPKISKFFGVTIDSLLTEQEEFVGEAYAKGGVKGERDANMLVEQVSSLFAGGRLSDDDKDAVMRAIQDAYWIAKEESKRKYTPKKYRGGKDAK
jgi:transcriptional regulator with XRE-family HTH domain